MKTSGLLLFRQEMEFNSFRCGLMHGLIRVSHGIQLVTIIYWGIFFCILLRVKLSG